MLGQDIDKGQDIDIRDTKVISLFLLYMELLDSRDEDGIIESGGLYQ